MKLQMLRLRSAFFTGAALCALAALPLAPARAVVAGAALPQAQLPHQAPHEAFVRVATDAEEAREFIDSMAGRAIEFIGNNKLSAAEKKREFDRLLGDSFDMKTIGRFALGRYWRAASEAERKEYLALFNDMVLEVYSRRFSEYDGQKFETRSVRTEGENDALVTSFIVPQSGPEVQVDWRVRQKNGRFKIVDVIVEGVSMSVTQRSDFAAVIQRGGGNIDVLLAHLRQQQNPSEN